ncbi:hypothetical protein [Lederbergia graminis]|uniref:Zinc ribbon domain-containing protein n=1 Tax=Lederbergia graminis TaxID=735518 RepID=A0ABW0LG72_9BACI
MVTALYVLGIMVIVVGVISGLLTNSLLGLLIAIFGSIVSAITLIALAKIIENQNTILFKLNKQDELVEHQETKKKKKMKNCPKCKYEYEEDRSSCPYCGYRHERKVKNRWID